MKILFYSTKDFEHTYLRLASDDKHIIQFHATALSSHSVYLSEGFDCISVFTADDVSAPILKILKENGVKYIAVRATGYDNINLQKAKELNMAVANVPAYSPYAVAEHATAMMLALNRKLILAHTQVHGQNFKLDRLIGFDIHGKTAGIIGTGRIGSVMAKILHGFGCRVLAYDSVQSQELQKNYQLEYTSLERLCQESDIITLHLPLNSKTKHLIDSVFLTEMKKGVMLINTSRGAVVDTTALISAIENGTVAYYGMDVYEKENGLFFYDHSGKQLNDPVFLKLMDMPNVLITPHQAFATKEALANIADTTFYNINCWEEGKPSKNEIAILNAQTMVI